MPLGLRLLNAFCATICIACLAVMFWLTPKPSTDAEFSIITLLGMSATLGAFGASVPTRNRNRRNRSELHPATRRHLRSADREINILDISSATPRLHWRGRREDLDAHVRQCVMCKLSPSALR